MSSSNVSSSASAWWSTHDGMLDTGRDVQHFALAHGNGFAADQELQRSLQHVTQLLALVRVHRHNGAALQVHLRQHLAVTGDEFAGDHLGHLFERDLIPAVEANWL